MQRETTPNIGGTFAPHVYFDMIQSKEISGLADLFANDATLSFGEVTLYARDQIISGYKDFLGSMASYRIEVVKVWPSGNDALVVEAVARGRNESEDREFAVPMVSVFELTGGRIRSQRDYFDPNPMFPEAQPDDPAVASGAADR